MLTQEQEKIIKEIDSNIQRIMRKSDEHEVALKRIQNYSSLDLSPKPAEPLLGRAFKSSYKAITDEEKIFFDFCRKGIGLLGPEECKTLTVADPVHGGYLAPPSFSNEIIKGVASSVIIRQLARVIEVDSESYKMPKRKAQFDAGWVSEIAERTETTGLEFGMETFTPHEMYAFVKVSLKQLEDSAFNLEAFLAEEFAERFGALEGTAFISGNAVGKPEGILTNADIATVVSGNASAITADCFIDLIAALKSGYKAGAAFVMNQTTAGAVRKLKDDQKNYLWANLAAGQPNTLLGYPVYEDQNMPDIAADAFPVLFGNFQKGYYIADRIRISVQRLSERYAEYGIVGFMARKRVDGQVVLAEAIKKLKIST